MARKKAPTPKRTAKAATTKRSRERNTPLESTHDEWIGPPPAESESAEANLLDVSRYSAAARTGRDEMLEHLHDHTEGDPRLTAGDVDADWASAYSTGDEAPGGDNPTPGQDVVSDVGRALGVEYQDNEELRAYDKVGDRDRHRWEWDPASADDYGERSRRGRSSEET